ncbi:MAG: nucleoside kinase [Clostridia bacterium]|nr:nucleoside kinase [Clostridia bacterium]MDD4387367.1 nucleoside kinase [Clostridia bacterium]
MNEINKGKITVTFENGKKISVAYKTKIVDAIKMVENNLDNIIAVKVNNEVKAFDYEIVTDSVCEYINFNSEDGYRVYTRTLKMILYMALTKLYSHADVQFISTINKDQYFIIKNIDLTEEKVEKIKNKMIEIIEKNYVIIKKVVPLEEAEVLYTASGDESKLDNIDNRIKSYSTMYFCDGLYNYFYGMLAPSTGYIKSFDLIEYKEGAMLVIPDDLSKGYEFKKEIKDIRIYDTFIAFNKLNDILGISNIGNLNTAVLNGKIQGIIQSSEAIHLRKIVEIVMEIEKRKSTKMILIAGPSSSGKTTFAQKLGVQLSLTGYNPITISMDNYFKERECSPVGSDGKYNFECIEALDIELFNKQINELILGKEVEQPEFDFIEGKKEYKGKKLKLQDNDVLIIEGIHALNPILTKFTDNSHKYKIYIAPIATLNIDDYTKISSTDTRLLRRMVRDYVTRGHSVEKTFELWGNVVKGEKQYIFPFVDEADCIFNSSLIYEPGVIKTFAQPLLLQLQKTSKYYSETRRLYEYLNNFMPIETTNIPVDSIMREFIGNGCFYR